jgi:hypothetical protein
MEHRTPEISSVANSNPRTFSYSEGGNDLVGSRFDVIGKKSKSNTPNMKSRELGATAGRSVCDASTSLSSSVVHQVEEVLLEESATTAATVTSSHPQQQGSISDSCGWVDRYDLSQHEQLAHSTDALQKSPTTSSNS